MKRFRWVLALLSLALAILPGTGGAFAQLPVPGSQEQFTFSPPEVPVTSSVAGDAAPIGLGPLVSGGDSLTLAVAFEAFAGPVDLYLAVEAPEISPNVFLFTAAGIRPLSAGLTPWKVGVTGPVDETVIPYLPLGSLDEGWYTLIAVATPAGRQDVYTAWRTQFLQKSWERVPVSHDEKLALLEGLKGAMATASGIADAGSRAEALRAFLAAQPLIEEAGIGPDGNAWGRFRDGEPVVTVDVSTGLGRASGNAASVAAGEGMEAVAEPVWDGRAPLPELEAVPWQGGIRVPAGWKPGSGQPPILPAAADAPPELPATTKCVLLESSGLSNAQKLVGDVLGKAGYGRPCYTGKGTLADLFNVTNTDIFFFSSHGAFYRNSRGVKMYIMNTTTRVTADSLKSTEPLRKGKVEEWELYPGCKYEDRVEPGETCFFFITPNFVKRYMSFGKNSVVTLDACNSWDTQMRSAFLGRKAATFLGWEKSVADLDSKKASEFLFDRLLGTNSDAVKPVEEPPLRPFSFPDVWAKLVRDGRNISRCAAGSKDCRVDAVLKSTAKNSVILVPNILFLTAVETLEQLWIEGEFGKSWGKVTVGGTEVPVVSWEPGRVVADLSDPKLAGDVVVEVGGRKSNPVPLTEWNGTLSYTFGYGKSGSTVTNMNLHLRADVHPYRISLLLPPYKRVGGWYLAKDSDAVVTASGDASNDGSELKLSGGCKVTMGDGLDGSGGYDMTKGTFSFTVTTWSSCLKVNGNERYVSESSSWFTEGKNGFEVSLDAAYRIAAGESTSVWTPLGTWFPIRNGKIKWPAITPNPSTVPDHASSPTPAILTRGGHD